MEHTGALYYEYDMEPDLNHRTPWGAIIALVLILSIVVAGAYYSFTKRYQPAPHSASTSQGY